MALNFPLTRTAFQSGIKVAQAMPFRLYRKEMVSETADEEIKALGPARWVAEFRLVDMYRAEAARVIALLEALGTTNRVRLYDPSTPYPKSDPAGAAIAGNTLTVFALGSNGRSLRIAGLPANFALSAGDMISVGYGSGRRALFRASEPVTANSGGTTPEFDVMPHLPVGLAPGDSVEMDQPYGLFTLAEFDPGVADGLIVAGVRFAARQVPV